MSEAAIRSAAKLSRERCQWTQPVWPHRQCVIATKHDSSSPHRDLSGVIPDQEKQEADQ